MRGTARITHQKFTRNAHLVPLPARRGAAAPPKDWLIPSVGCSCGYINHYGADIGAEKGNFQEDSSTPSRKPNVRLRPVRGPSDMVRPDLFTMVTTCEVPLGRSCFSTMGPTLIGIESTRCSRRSLARRPNRRDAGPREGERLCVVCVCRRCVCRLQYLGRPRRPITFQLTKALIARSWLLFDSPLARSGHGPGRHMGGD